MKRKDLDLGKDGNKATNFWGCHIPLSSPPNIVRIVTKTLRKVTLT